MQTPLPGTLRNLSEVFSKDKYPTLSFAFEAEFIDRGSNHRPDIIYMRDQKVHAWTLTYDHHEAFCRMIVITPMFFRFKGGVSYKAHLYKALLDKYNLLALPRSLFGMIWTNVLPKYTDLFDSKVAKIKIWDQKKIALLDYRRTLDLILWYQTVSTHHKKNLSSLGTRSSFSEYVNSVDYPLSTLRLNFQQAAAKHVRWEVSRRMKSSTPTTTSAAP